MIEIKVSNINNGYLKFQSLSEEFAEKYFQIVKEVVGEKYEEEHEEFIKDATELLNKEFGIGQMFEVARDCKEVSIVKDEPAIF